MPNGKPGDHPLTDILINDRAGSTYFVVPMAQATMIMFVVADVHPFSDGN